MRKQQLSVQKKSHNPLVDLKHVFDFMDKSNKTHLLFFAENVSSDKSMNLGLKQS